MSFLRECSTLTRHAPLAVSSRLVPMRTSAPYSALLCGPSLAQRQAEILEAWSQHGMRSDTLEQHIAPPGELASASRADTSGLTAATVRFSPAASASPPPGTASEEAQAKQAAMGPTTRDE